MDYENRPQTPPEEDCCGNGCSPCISDVHKELLERWKGKTMKNPKENALSPSSYKTFFLQSVFEVCKDFLMLRFLLKDESDRNVGVNLRPGQYVFVRIGNVSRPFTPISWSSTKFTILARLYDEGKMSELLKSIEKDAKVDVRGPYGDFEYIRNSFKQIVMLSIGSAVAAIYPVAKSIVLDDLEDSRIHMVLSFRCFSQIPMKDDLRLLCDYWNLSCTIFLSQEKDKQVLSGIKLVNCRLDEETILEALKPHSANSTLVLVAGTKEFMKQIKRCLIENHYLHHHVF